MTAATSEAGATGSPYIAGTVHQAFERSVAACGEHDFLCILPETAERYGIQAHTWSYESAAREVRELRERYARAGLGHGHRAGLLLENRPAMFFHWLALNALGVSVVPINAEWRSAELEYLVSHSDIAIAVAPHSRVADLTRAAEASGCPLTVTVPDLSPLTRVTRPVPHPDTPPDEQTECALLYTSGTTGKPKGCVLANEYFLWEGTWYGALDGVCAVRPGVERLITPLPMSHMNAMAVSTMAMLMSGGCIVPLDRFHPGTWWRAVRESRASIVHYLGVMPAMLLGAPPSESDRDHALRFGFGAGVSPRLHAAFEQRFGFPLVEAWAMTETGAGAVVIANHEPRKVGTACFGRPQPLVECRVVSDGGANAGVNEPGELWVRSRAPNTRFGFFREYLKDPRATAEAWEGGYFHTGDVVYRDADGDLHFVDRKKNVIRRSGENISAVEVEGVLLQHPRVASVGVAAVPDEVRGDEVMACIVTRTALAAEERQTLARELVQFCLEKLAYFKAPGYVSFCEALPLTPTEKIQRARLKELAHDSLTSGRTIDLRPLKKRTAA